MPNKLISQLPVVSTSGVALLDAVVINQSATATTKTATVQQVKDAIIPSTANGYGTRTVSSDTPTGGADGDIWYQY